MDLAEISISVGHASTQSHRPTMRFSSRQFLFASGAFALAACTSKDAATGGGANGGTLIFAAPGDAKSLFPPYVVEQNGRLVQDLVFDRLAEISADNNTIGDKTFKPQLAKSWTWAPDSMSIAFSLNPAAKWHDGQPVRANDVKYSFDIFTNPKVASPNATGLANIDSVSVRDSLTPVVWFKKHTPTQNFLAWRRRAPDRDAGARLRQNSDRRTAHL